MRKRLALLLVLVLGCGGGGFDLPTTKAGDTESGNEQPYLEQVKLVSSALMPDFRYKYVLSLSPSEILNDKTEPFVLADINKWVPWAVDSTEYDVDGNYLFTVISYDREIAFTYGGNHSINSWADIKESKYYDEPGDSLVVGLCDGKIYKKGEAPFRQPPGEGDNVLRLSLSESGTELTMYFNNLGTVAGVMDMPFHFGNYSNWLAENQTIADSSGWGKAIISIVQPAEIIGTFGGDFSKNSWGNVTDSVFYDVAVDAMHFYVEENKIVLFSAP